MQNLILGHSQTRICGHDCRLGFDRDDFAQEIRSRLDLFWIGDGLMPFLVEDTAEIRNELVEEDFSHGGG